MIAWESTMITWKYLSLVTPAHAQLLGVPAEAPVLVSPHTRAAMRCRRCDTGAAPLVYQVGAVVRTTHRAAECPGVYHYHDFDQVAWQTTSRVARLVALGEADCGWTRARWTDDPACARGRAFRVQALRACCVACATWQLVLYAADGAWPLLLHGQDLSHDCELLPVCAACAAQPRYRSWRTPWVLVLRDGVPSFRYAPHAEAP